MVGGGLSFSSLRGSARKMKTKVSEVERGGVIDLKEKICLRINSSWKKIELESKS